ncbi:glutathione ABC transporter permease [Roseobacter cerasinus]|uniref:Glutathione ABC transporter permease n=1 Tax=Roseobacter cerasinus TaxID=2602289 RepID=A0A640VPU3_9RHOB|nr:ABC transporter permease [Roseobacter cerasinus]GFE49702.1 glutathione ABC transporter permease [Roseobacter cerasinus]
MLRFIFTRLSHMLIALFVITVIVFSLSHLTGSPIDALLPDDATQQQIDSLTEHLGLDRPYYVQYLTFLQNAAVGDFGDSTKWKGNTAAGVVLERLPATLKLGGLAVLISVAVAIPLGVLSAIWRGSIFDRMAGIIALLGQSFPAFWLGIILMWIFAVTLGWFPTSGYGGLSYMILPAIAMAWFQIAALTRLTRSAMLEVLDTEYVKLARVKGVSERAVIWKHAFRNAAIVPVTYFGVLAGSLLTGSVVVETVFAWPGTGLLAIDAIRGRDFPVVQSVVMFFAVFYLLANFLVDVLYAVVDPRIRFS